MEDGFVREEKIFVRNMMSSFLKLNYKPRNGKNSDVYERKTREEKLQIDQNNHGEGKYEDTSVLKLKKS